jgi:hypothetical protein
MEELKPVPAFKSGAEERKFWETHDSTIISIGAKPCVRAFQT